MFRRNVLNPSSWSKNNPRKKPSWKHAASRETCDAGLWLGLFFYSEDGGKISARNIGFWLSFQGTEAFITTTIRMTWLARAEPRAVAASKCVSSPRSPESPGTAAAFRKASPHIVHRLSADAVSSFTDHFELLHWNPFTSLITIAQ
jgi:hypothetical protein